MKALVAAGGSGTRLRPLTFSSNKHLLPIANKPLLLYAIEAIAKTGIKEVGVIVNSTKPAIENLLGNGSTWGMNITYISQEKPLGLGHIVMISRDFIDGDSFLYHLGDNIFSEGIMRPYNHFMEKKPNALLSLIEHEENNRMGVPFFDETGKLIKVVEKPMNPPNKFGVPGLYFFDHHVFEAFEGPHAIKPSARGEYEITDLYTFMLQQGYQVDTEQIDGTWLDPGKFNDMLQANEFMLKKNQSHECLGEVDSDSRLRGPVCVGKGSKIINSHIVGPVSIGTNSYIKNAVIGPNVSIQNDVVIEDVTIHNSILMSGVEIKHIQTPIIDSMIGKNTKIWKERRQSTSLFIGDNCNVRLR